MAARFKEPSTFVQACAAVAAGRIGPETFHRLSVRAFSERGMRDRVDDATAALGEIDDGERSGELERGEAEELRRDVVADLRCSAVERIRRRFPRLFR